MNLVIPSVVIILLMFIMAFLIFKNIVKRLDVNTKKYFVEKMQEYEYLLKEKQTELENLKNQVNKYENDISSIEDTLKVLKNKKHQSYDNNMLANYVPFDHNKLHDRNDERILFDRPFYKGKEGYVEDIENDDDEDNDYTNGGASKKNNVSDNSEDSNNSGNEEDLENEDAVDSDYDMNDIRKNKKPKYIDENDYRNMQLNMLSDKNSSDDNQEGKSTELLNYIRLPEYKEDSFFYNYKRLKKEFYFDNENLLRAFIKKQVNSNDNKIYNDLMKIKRNFDNNAVYQLITLSSENQKKIISEVLSDEEKELIKFNEKFKNSKKFSTIDFLNYLKELIKKYDPIVYVYVSRSDKSYDYVGKNVKTMYYSNMSEGIIIKYKNRIYDYSI